MRLGIYIVRYKETEVLYKCLRSIGRPPNTDIYIINNFSKLQLPLRFHYVNVLDNVLRPDFSTGHLSRNWNQAIINGFQDLDNPKYDAIIAIQADAILAPTWYNNLIALDSNIHYMALGRGDEFQYFTPSGIKTVGLFDERYCNIGYQEADYFLRNVLHMKDNAVIIDYGHNRFNNESMIDPMLFIIRTELDYNAAHIESRKYHDISLKWFAIKWNMFDPENWNHDEINKIQNTLFREIMLYPYFEKKINPQIYSINDPQLSRNIHLDLS